MLLEDDPGMIHSERWYDAAVSGAGSGEHMEFLDLLLNASAPVPETIRDIIPGPLSMPRGRGEKLVAENTVLQLGFHLNPSR